MKTSPKLLVVAAVLSLAASAASAEAPTAGVPAAASERRCPEGAAKCGNAETTRMSRAMIDACAKTPEACKERHEKAAARRAAKSAQANPAKE